MNRLESKIRDYLELNIEALGQDLTFIKKEFPLKNPNGAGGSIDLLALDPLGHYVIIELKRSDQAARAALHELTKYAALSRSQMGLRRDQLRVLLVSTEWHELAVPFSEYLDICAIPTEGIEIVVDSNGVVLSAKPFVPLDIAEPLSVSRSQDLVLFAKVVDRDIAFPRVVSAAKSASLSDFAVFFLDYRGANTQIIYPCGIYLVFSSPLQSLDASTISDLKSKANWDDDLDEPDENFLVNFRNHLGDLGDESGIGYPEKLAKIESDGWLVTVAHRAGRYARNLALVPDHVLIGDAKKTEGGAAYYFRRITSPKYAPGWKKMKSDVGLVLLGDTKWIQLFSAILDEIELQRPSATVSISIYNLANIVFGLAKLFRFGDVGYLPTLQVVVEDTHDTTIYFGDIGWNGQLTTLSGHQWIRECFGSEGEFMINQHFGHTFEVEELARRRIGLCSRIVEVRYAGSAHEQAQIIDMKAKKVRRTSMTDSKLRPISDFHDQNLAFGHSLVQWAGAATTGWV
jgi:hypothetical protein